MVKKYISGGVVRNLSILFLTVAMALVFATPTFAASIPSSGDPKVTTTDTTLNIPYNIKVKNPTLTTVDGPDINYTFSIAPETYNLGRVTDSSSNTATIHAGPANGVSITHNPSFTGNKTASSGGANNSDNITLSVDLTKFNAPGVYRYKLTDTTADSTLRNAGMVRDPDYDPVRYVDVYIENDTNGLKVKGYVVSDEMNNKETFDNKVTKGYGEGKHHIIITSFDKMLSDSSFEHMSPTGRNLVNDSGKIPEKSVIGTDDAWRLVGEGSCPRVCNSTNGMVFKLNNHEYNILYQEYEDGEMGFRMKDENGNTGLIGEIWTDPETGITFVIVSKPDGSAFTEKLYFEWDPSQANSDLTPIPYTGNASGETIETIDTYNTYNITVEKEVTGAMGNRSNQFAFTGTVANNGNNNFYVKKGSAPTASDSMVSSIPNFTLAHGEKYYISGLGPKATIAYTERNNTSDTYKVTINGKTSQIASQSSIYANDTKSMSATAITNYATANNSGTPNTEATLGNSSEVKFTNHLDSVSPTGVVMRYGPYIGMFVIAMMLLAVYKRTRKTSNAA